jgi:CheY-like chemotaxis protein
MALGGARREPPDRMDRSGREADSVVRNARPAGTKCASAAGEKPKCCERSPTRQGARSLEIIGTPAHAMWHLNCPVPNVLMRTPRPRVLVADDYTDLLVALKLLLSTSCEVVGCVADGGALFEALPRVQPDVVVVDLFIPPGNGLEICRLIKRVAPETVVIVISASTDPEIAQETVRAGGAAFINKATASDELIPAIQRAMATRLVPAPERASDTAPPPLVKAPR